jgi:hypothetical protein
MATRRVPSRSLWLSLAVAAAVLALASLPAASAYGKVEKVLLKGQWDGERADNKDDI